MIDEAVTLPPTFVGDTLSYSGTVLLPSGTWSGAASLVDASGSKVADLVVTLTPMGTPTATANHLISVELSAEECDELDADTYRSQVKFTDTAGVVMRSPVYLIPIQVAVS